NAYATLLTRPSYLPGVILLAYSLHRHSPSTPLVIMYTADTFPQQGVYALHNEARRSNCIVHPVEHLQIPPTSQGEKKGGMVAARFQDTFTKLRVFGLHELGFTTVCFLDADMLILHDPSDLIFGTRTQDWLDQTRGLGILATHACVCNLDADAWAPASWTRDNCAYVQLTSPNGVPSVSADPSSTHSLLNSGTFVFYSSKEIDDFVLQSFMSMSAEKLAGYQFPDQDFLTEVFTGKWASLNWRANALKTWRYWHPELWKADGEPVVLHYIVDKPWAARVKKEGEELVAGYLGKDGVTHGWWWDVWARWVAER
ncbi:nucleotide-diphospho-sugar transferase, partial [Massariosphaeria phaeospora]